MKKLRFDWCKNYRYLLFLVVWVGCIRIYAQEYPVTRYTNHDGLPQMQCRRVFEDSRGYIWVATLGGFSKFDGDTFENFRTRDGLGSSTIGGFAEDRSGNLWVASLRGLIKFDGDTLLSYHHQEFIDPWTLAMDRNDNIFVLTLHGKKKLFQFVSKKWRQVQDIPKGWEPTGLYSSRYNKTIFISFKKKGLFRYESGKLFSVYPQLSLPNTLTDLYYFSEPKGYNVIAGKLENGNLIFLWNCKNKWQPFLKINNTNNTISVLQNIPFDYLFNHNGKVYLMEKNNSKLKTILLGTQIVHAHADSIGYWIASNQGLIHVFTNGLKYFSDKQVPSAGGVIEKSIGKYWIIQNEKPILEYNNQVLTSLPDEFTPEPGFNNRWAFIPVKDKNNALWLGSFNKLFRLENNKFQPIKTDTQNENILMGILYSKTHDYIILNGYKQLNLHSVDSPFKQVKTISEKNGIQTGVYNSFIEDKKGILWIGGKGISTYDLSTNKAYNYEAFSKQLPARGIMSLCEDNQGGIWVGAAEGGCLYYNKLTDQFFPILSNIFKEGVLSVKVLNDNFLLIADAWHIYVLDLKQFYRSKRIFAKIFTHRNGFVGVEVLDYGYYRDSKGIVWLATGTVLMQLDPSRMNLTPSPVRMYFTNINNKRIPYRRRNADSVAVLPYGQNTITVGFEAVGVNKPLQPKYSYRIPGINDQWSSWQIANQATITNLPPGLYTIELKTLSGDLTETEDTIERLQFRVSLPVWQWPIFPYLATGLVLVFAVISGYYFVRSRQNAIRLQHQEQQLLFLQVQALQAQLNPHFVFNVLGTMQHMILSNDLDQANRGLLRLADLIRGFLESSIRSEMPKSRSAEAEVKLDKELEMLKMYVEFEHLQYRDAFTYSFDIDNSLVTSMWSLPPMLIQPFVENAIKHGLLYRKTPGHLSVGVRMEKDDWLHIKIEDDGVGREAARQRQAQSIKSYVSRGSGLVQKRIDVLNQMGYRISITTQDRPDGGTVVNLLIGYTE